MEKYRFDIMLANKMSFLPYRFRRWLLPPAFFPRTRRINLSRKRSWKYRGIHVSIAVSWRYTELYFYSRFLKSATISRMDILNSAFRVPPGRWFGQTRLCLGKILLPAGYGDCQFTTNNPSHYNSQSPFQQSSIALPHLKFLQDFGTDHRMWSANSHRPAVLLSFLKKIIIPRVVR